VGVGGEVVWGEVRGRERGREEEEGEKNGKEGNRIRRGSGPNRLQDQPKFKGGVDDTLQNI